MNKEEQGNVFCMGKSSNVNKLSVVYLKVQLIFKICIGRYIFIEQFRECLSTSSSLNLMVKF